MKFCFTELHSSVLKKLESWLERLHTPLRQVIRSILSKKAWIVHRDSNSHPPYNIARALGLTIQYNTIHIQYTIQQYMSWPGYHHESFVGNIHVVGLMNVEREAHRKDDTYIMNLRSLIHFFPAGRKLYKMIILQVFPLYGSGNIQLRNETPSSTQELFITFGCIYYCTGLWRWL